MGLCVGRVTQVGELHREGHGLGHDHVLPFRMSTRPVTRTPVNRIGKYRAEDFRATVDDDPERAEFWLEHTIRVLDELSCTDTAYQWWDTLVSGVPRKRVT
ncbi:DNA-dependent protein kinase catalytic subunit [Gossypium australe]|uniref:DNA-dependent protein kinase catalytic subunit n=1 Tax=Gossypium australe TaxID=47621 RepID=A0A5B6X037_9ROSI|nr:DNA-dependent protein kinase catalytic subunit [Gossypium australe]